MDKEIVESRKLYKERGTIRVSKRGVNMGIHEITLHLKLDEAQEQLINNLFVTCREKYNYIRSDIIDHILHSDFYYEFTNDKRTVYDDLYLSILNMIIDREDKWNSI